MCVLGILIQTSLLLDGLFREGQPSILSRGGERRWGEQARRKERDRIWERMKEETRERRTREREDRG